tara:strand:- start:59 stop:613 length:555 start_codon:yes stop_codon:yes gene_type:complete
MPIADIACGVVTGSELAATVNAIKDLAESLKNSTYWFVTRSNASAISHTAGATNTFLTNNANTVASHNPDGKTPLWDAATGKFDLSDNKIGDVIHFTARATFNNLAAQEIDMFISVSEGTSTAHEHQINHTYYKTAASNTGLTFTYHMVIEDTDELYGGCRFRFASVQAASISVDNFTTIVTVV